MKQEAINNFLKEQRIKFHEKWQEQISNDVSKIVI